MPVMSAPARRQIFSGAIIGGKYRVERVLASGGQGTVVEATHLRLRHPVAIKFPHVDEAHPDDRWGRLFREARAAVRLRGEHVARVMDVDVVDGAPFIVMEYLRGIDLQSSLERRGPLPLCEAVGLLLQACDGLAEAHDLGIVHRDLKPSNLFLVDRPGGPPLLKVLDFGLAKSLGPRVANVDDPDLTEPLLVLGTPRYMSPEQARDSRAVDLRTDIWSLGVILQEMLTGRPVFRARNRADVIAQVLLKNPTPITLLRPGTPPELEHVLLRCLQKAPEHRFSSARELAAALAPFAPSWAAPVVARLAAKPPLVSTELPSWESGSDEPEAPMTNELVTPLPNVLAEAPTVAASPAPAEASTASAVTRVLPEQRAQPIVPASRPSRRGTLLGGVALTAMALAFSWHVEGTLHEGAARGAAHEGAAISTPTVLATARADLPSPSMVPVVPSLLAPTIELLPPSAVQDVPPASQPVSPSTLAPAERPRAPMAAEVRKAARRASLARRGAAPALPAPKIASLDRSRPGRGAPKKSRPTPAVVADMDNPLDGRK